MQVSIFEHEGVNYTFKPPVEVGDHVPESVTELVAIGGCMAE